MFYSVDRSAVRCEKVGVGVPRRFVNGMKNPPVVNWI